MRISNISAIRPVNPFFKKTTAALTLLVMTLYIFTGCKQGQQGTEADQKIASKVDSLIGKMTLEEKVGQLTLFTSDMTTTGPSMRGDYQKLIKAGKVGAIFNAYGSDYTRNLQKMAVENSRLGIPLLFGYDVIHGFRTTFPIPLGESSSWDPDLIRQASAVAAHEAAAAGLHWTYAPMVDIARDPRWGRIAEGAGEDTYLGSKIAAARVHGFQGKDLSDPSTVLACVKHYAAYGAAEGGRDYNTVNMSERRLREIYLPPFKAAVDAGVGTVMTAFNELNGIPATENKFLLDTVLRNEWGFKGFVVTDYTSIPEMIAHGVPKNGTAAAEMALEAGVDMDMQSGLYLEKLPGLVKKGEVSEETVNKAVARVLRMKYKLGLFDDPYRYCNPGKEKKELLSRHNRDMERKVARESMVLLKNKKALLPLDKDIKNLAVIGPLADNQKEQLGPWSGAGRAEDNITVLQGIRQAVGSGTNIRYAKGCEITGDSRDGFSQALGAARNADAAVMVLGEAANMSGEAASRATLDLPGQQEALLQAIHKTGTPVILVLMNGRPLTITWADENVPAILESWFPGTEGGPAVADILFGDYNPSGKLTVTFPRTVGQVPYYYNHKNTGRPMDPDQKYTSKYIDVPNKPLYPFGYGLSYSDFEYSDITLDHEKMSPDSSLRVSVTVKNTGKRKGQEIVQLYIRDLFASVTRPIEELKGFQKIMLGAGDSRKVTFTLAADDLSFYNQDMKKVVEPGRFDVFVGPNSRDVKKAEFEVTK